MPDLNKEGNGFIKEVTPSLKQEQLLQVPDDVFEVLYGGAAYGGKSFILTLLPAIRGFYKYHGFKGLILRRTFPDLERENIRLTKEYLPSTGAVYNEAKHFWHWPAYGSYLDFGHIQHTKDVRRYDSSQYNYVFYEELTHFEESAYMYLVGSRIRPSSEGCNIAIARSGCNPGGIGQSFVYNRFVKPYEPGGKIIKDKNTGLLRLFIKALIQDNPKGLEFDPLYAQKLEMLPEAEKRAKKYGDWHAFKGSVFTTFRPIRFPNEPINALHVIPKFIIPEWWPRLLSIDWGKRAMCHAMWAAISPDRRIYIYRERTWRGKDLPFWASEIKEIIYDEGIEPVSTTLCGSAWQERGVETIAEQFQRYSGLVPSSSENTQGSRISGLQLIHDYLRWENVIPLKSKEEFYDIEKAQIIFRNFGSEALERYRSQFYDEKIPDNLPILQMFEGECPVLEETIPMCIYNSDKGHPEDIAEFDGDDPIDNLRYLCKAARKLLNGETSYDIKLAMKRAEILSNKSDMTSFYRQMERLEKGDISLDTLIRNTLPANHSPRMRHSRFARRH